MNYGIDAFARDQQGWSFVAVRAPVERVTEVLAKRAGVLRHEPNVRVQPMGENAAIQGEHERRHAFLVKPSGSEWAALVLTVHWFENADALFATLLAAELSDALGTRAVAAWDDDFSGVTVIVCEKGQKSSVLGDEDDADAFNAFFEDQRLALPECFISTDGAKSADAAQLLAGNPSDVERADHFLLAVPEALRSDAPHVFEKLGMMADAVAAEGDDEADFPEDESEFRTAMVEGIWKRADAVRRASKRD